MEGGQEVALPLGVSVETCNPKPQPCSLAFLKSRYPCILKKCSRENYQKKPQISVFGFRTFLGQHEIKFLKFNFRGFFVIQVTYKLHRILKFSQKIILVGLGPVCK